MKQSKRFFCLMLTVVFSIVGILGIQTPPTQAKRIINKVKLLENGKTYSYDINGDGKKESILVKVVETYSNNIAITTTIYVNGNVYYKVKSKYGIGAQVLLCDLYANQKGANLLIEHYGESDGLSSLRVIKCEQDKGTLLASMSGKTFGKLNIYRINLSSLKVTGNGTFTMLVDTPIYLGNFGCYFVSIPFKISGKKIKLTPKKSYKISSDFTYKLKKQATLYTKPSKKASKTTLAVGSKLKIVAVYPVSYNQKKYIATSFVKVKTKSGKTGWIFDKSNVSDENKLCGLNIPQWG